MFNLEPNFVPLLKNEGDGPGKVLNANMSKEDLLYSHGPPRIQGLLFLDGNSEAV